MADIQSFTDAVQLAIGGRLYAGWTDVTVERSLDAQSGSFSLTLSSKEDASGQPLAIAPDDRCQVKIGSDVVIDGWVDAVTIELGTEEHSLRVEGRDKTADLADCSAIHKSGSWTGAKIEAIIGELAKPFGVTVTAKASTGAAIRKFALQQGETVGTAAERLLRFRGLIAVAGTSGDLEITTPDTGAPIGTLAQGVNIERATGTRNHRERYSDYVVKGQAAGDDNRHGKQASQIRGNATDSGVRRYRPLLVMAEEQGDGASLAVRAKFEAGVRAGRSIGEEIVAPGWRVAPGGALWAPNRRVRLQCPAIGVADAARLIVGVRFSKNDSEGTTTTLTLAPPEAWAQLPEKEAA